MSSGSSARAVFFDVDFTLIYPGPTFHGEGYRDFCSRYGMTVNPALFGQALAKAAPLLDGPEDAPYDAEIFVKYTRAVIEGMGGAGERIDACAREIYDEWAAYRHFELYADVPPVLRELTASGIRIGLISNTHRSLASFQSHFALDGLISVTVSSSEHGYMKPHPSIFSAALRMMQVPAPNAVMVGDSVRHDVEGALRAGMRAVLLDRRDRAEVPDGDAALDALRARGVPVIRSLGELPALIAR